ncbi:hypothetical protein KZ483_04755 [Paenibacillus sp. sptzw28]|uniref:hypothetical protein n=1 Tax=Paenibacillus sp. sptzw28 TaxID=715179 RepID=UPI001C6F492E|nr:hypothetical protein [Paenibacillus sp. sptzw28]QYR22308.1 hypothetical protein KZ483_04755 [Paenibacillus sp. sptzw28]
MMLWDKKWLVTCCNQLGGLFKLDPKTGEYEKLLGEDCRGIAKYNNQYVLATTSSGLLLLDNHFQVIHSNKLALDYHGVAVDRNVAYVVETHRNAIGMYLLPGFQKVNDIKLFPEETDVLHLNDLFIQGDRLFVSMFCLNGPWRPQKERPSGGIMELSLITRQPLRVHYPEAVHHPHSVCMVDGKLMYCSSYPGEVKHGTDVVFRTPGYARGLYCDAKQMGIGNSRTRWNNGEQEQAGIYIFQRDDKSIRFVPLPVSEVYGILPL